MLAAFRAGGGDFDAGRYEYGLLGSLGLRRGLRAELVALPPSHPYLRLPLQFAASLRPRLTAVVPVDELNRCIGAAEAELADPSRWGLTFTLVQSWATLA